MKKPFFLPFFFPKMGENIFFCYKVLVSSVFVFFQHFIFEKYMFFFIANLRKNDTNG